MSRMSPATLVYLRFNLFRCGKPDQSMKRPWTWQLSMCIVSSVPSSNLKLLILPVKPGLKSEKGPCNTILWAVAILIVSQDPTLEGCIDWWSTFEEEESWIENDIYHSDPQRQYADIMSRHVGSTRSPATAIVIVTPVRILAIKELKLKPTGFTKV